jgi:hypothetical protein
LKLLQKKLAKGGDVLEYISILKNIKLEICKVRFTKVDDSLMETIVIVGFPPYYKHILETLHLTSKLENTSFY